MNDAWQRYVIDASMCTDELLCFCPIEGDPDDEFSVVTGMNYLGNAPPRGGKLVGVWHPDGPGEADAWMFRNHGRLAALRLHPDTMPTPTPPIGCLAVGWDRAIAQLYQMFALEDDWDGDGADAPSAEIINSAFELATELQKMKVPAPDRATATRAGTVAFEWRRPDDFASVETVGYHRYDWFRRFEGQPPTYYRQTGKPAEFRLVPR